MLMKMKLRNDKMPQNNVLNKVREECKDAKSR